MKSLQIIAIILLIANTVYSQEKSPIIKSNSSLVSIKDGDNLRINSWALAPEAKPHGGEKLYPSCCLPFIVVT